MRKSTKLPEGVGKKIIEALKSQPQTSAEAPKEVNPSFEGYIKPTASENRNSFKQSLKRQVPPVKVHWDDEDEPSAPSVKNQQQYKANDDENNFAYNPDDNPDDYITADNDDYQTYQPEASDDSSTDDFEVYENNDDLEEDDNSYAPEGFEADDDFYEDYQPSPIEEPRTASRFKPEVQYQEEKPKASRQKTQLSPNSNSNVNIIMNLVHQLPSGVTKQTGAHIIRQTMEAMGIPMNKVLGEAQYLQEELGKTIKDNINTIEEYRNNIKTLEKEVQGARNKSEELEELISLFTFTDR